MRVRLGPFAPDLPPLDGGAVTIRNVIPILGPAYAPVRALDIFSSALDSRCRGVVYVLDSDGNVHGFAGDEAKLYELTGITATWANVSKVGGYATTLDNIWSFTQVEQLLIATNYDDAIQAWDFVTPSTAFADLAATAPKAKYATTIRRILVVGNIIDATYGEGTNPYYIWWPDNEDPTNWPDPTSDTAVQVRSGFKRCNPNFGHITGLIGGLASADGAVFQQRGVSRIIFQESGDAFDLDELEGVRGTSAPRSICQAGGLAYYIGEDGFYAFDGASSAPIGSGAVDQEFLSLVDQSQLERIVSAAHPTKRLIFWSFITTDGDNLMFIHNTESKEWSLTDGIEVEEFARILSPGWTLEDLDTVYATLEDVPGSLDDPIWRGSKIPALAAFNTSHELAIFGGDTLEATLETVETEPFPGRRAHVDSIIPLTDAPSCSVRARLRDRQADVATDSWADGLDDAGRCVIDECGRYMAWQLTIPAGTEWTQAQGLEISAQPMGFANPGFVAESAVANPFLLDGDGQVMLDGAGEFILA